MRRWILPNAHTTNTRGIMTPQQKEIQILIGDLNRETQVLNNFLDAQTKRIQNIKDRIDYQLQIIEKNNDN